MHIRDAGLMYYQNSGNFIHGEDIILCLERTLFKINLNKLLSISLNHVQVPNINH